VEIEDIVGDVTDLIGSTILTANENVSKGGSYEECSTWTATHYDIATIKGNVPSVGMDLVIVITANQ
jgi:hypothetical protein